MNHNTAQFPPFLSELLERWFRLDLLPHRKSAKLIYQRARSALAAIIALNPAIAFAHFSDFTRPRVQSYLAYRQSTFAGEEGTRKIVQALRHFFRFAESEHLFGPQVSHQLRGLSPVIRYTEPTALTLEQEQHLLTRAHWCHTGNPSIPARDWKPGAFHVACLLGLRQGLRPSEILGLSWAEIDLPNKLLALQDNPLRGLKTARAATPLLLHPDLHKPLHRLQTANVQPYLFTTGPRFPRWFALWQSLAKELAIPGLNAYWLRRTCATRLVDANMDIQGLLNFMRHADVNTSQRYYVARAQGQPISYITGRKMPKP